MRTAKTWRLGVIAIAVLGLAGSAGRLEGAGEPQIIRVQVSVRNFSVTPARVKAGKATVLVENFTLVPSPTVTIRDQGAANPAAGFKVEKPVKVKPRESWHEVVLTPGTYWVSLDQVPGVQAALVVEP
ncbi:MAG: hypothetical protein HY858_10670 [Candidatus Solibacter usitatus]|nr:hypothetical protein [Candidatus Solibacter usitatus]